MQGGADCPKKFSSVFEDVVVTSVTDAEKDGISVYAYVDDLAVTFPKDS